MQCHRLRPCGLPLDIQLEKLISSRDTAIAVSYHAAAYFLVTSCVVRVQMGPTNIGRGTLTLIPSRHTDTSLSSSYSVHIPASHRS